MIDIKTPSSTSKPKPTQERNGTKEYYYRNREKQPEKKASARFEKDLEEIHQHIEEKDS